MDEAQSGGMKRLTGKIIDQRFERRRQHDRAFAAFGIKLITNKGISP